MTDFVMTDKLITMDPNVKAKWVADLRDGNLKQTKGVLAREDTGAMCCLGVLTVQAEARGIAKQYDTWNRYISGDDTNVPCRVFQDEDGALSETGLTRGVAVWAGMVTVENPDAISAGGVLPFKDAHDRLVYLDGLNDDGMPFSQIADLIDYWY